MFALGISTWGDALPAGVLQGLKVVAVAVVAQAVWGMARNLCTDRACITIAAVSACIALLWSTAWGQVGVIAAAAAVGLLVGLPILVQAWPNQTLAISDAFYRSGSLVFGGGHVVLPLLQAEAVPHGWVTNDTFPAGS